MTTLGEIPAFQSKDLTFGECNLEFVSSRFVESLDEAWKLVPDDGSGVIVLADLVRRHDPGDKTGFLLEADVVVGDQTVVVRTTGEGWKAWTWRQSSGNSHRWVEYRLRSTEPAPGRRSPDQFYRQYWGQVEDDGLQVWKPVGCRFVGFAEESKK